MIAPRRGRWAAAALPLAGAALGASFFFWIAGIRVIDPTETAWTMQLDWQHHFLGWHFFRHEAWHVPPGRLDGYLAPLGTSVGLLDAIPLAAFLFRPFASMLPAAFQYLGLWMLCCFALQGVFGVVLMRLWTSSARLQLLGAGCLILVPTLLSRVGHAALCAHWLLLWAIWLYLRTDLTARARATQVAALGLLAGLIHPYLAAMVLGLFAALGLRLFVEHWLQGMSVFAVGVCGVVTGWWLSGIFVITSPGNFAARGLTEFSMNLLGPITASGWSSLLPDLPVAIVGQLWEGFQYLGLGLLLLIAGAVVVRLVRQARPAVTMPTSWPLVGVVALFAVYSLSPHVTLGSASILDWDSPLFERLSFFRATGRFFWPAAYLALISSLAAISRRMTPVWATSFLCAVVIVQLVDLHPGHMLRRQASHDPAFHGWTPQLASPAWRTLLPHYAHVVLYPPTYCGIVPVDLASIGYLAGLYGLTINSGHAARTDEARRAAACRALADTLLRGEVDDSRVYLGRPGELDKIMRTVPVSQPVVCGVLDGAELCVTARSYAPWRTAARLD